MYLSAVTDFEIYAPPVNEIILFQSDDKKEW